MVVGFNGSGAGSMGVGNGDVDRSVLLGVGEALDLDDSVALGLLEGSAVGLIVGDSEGVAVLVGLTVGVDVVVLVGVGCGFGITLRVTSRL